MLVSATMATAMCLCTTWTLNIAYRYLRKEKEFALRILGKLCLPTYIIMLLWCCFDVIPMYLETVMACIKYSWGNIFHIVISVLIWILCALFFAATNNGKKSIKLLKKVAVFIDERIK